jgi:amino acid permease
MQEQNFKNHSKYVPLYHLGAYLLLLAVLIGSIINLTATINTGEGVYSASLILVLTIAVLLVCWYARSFALKAQDRAIRAEENFRHFVATGKPLDSRLRMGQIVALRFAGDDEFVALAKKAADENIGSKDIKMAIKNWKADSNRV